MRWLIAGLALVVTTSAAVAQLPQQNQINAASSISRGAARQAQEKNDKPKANDKAYNAALKNLPNKQYDPWHGVR